MQAHIVRTINECTLILSSTFIEMQAGSRLWTLQIILWTRDSVNKKSALLIILWITPSIIYLALIVFLTWTFTLLFITVYFTTHLIWWGTFWRLNDFLSATFDYMIARSEIPNRIDYFSKLFLLIQTKAIVRPNSEKFQNFNLKNEHLIFKHHSLRSELTGIDFF